MTFSLIKHHKDACAKKVAFDNFGSQKVLEKCGFAKIGSEKGFANARNAEVEEFIYNLTINR